MHELDSCVHMQVICEGCGLRITKQQQIKHESLECSNPLGKCGFCKRVFSLTEMALHMRSCSLRTTVKVEYGQETHSNLALIEDRELLPESLYNPKEQLQRKKAKPLTCEYCHQKLTSEQQRHKCYEIEAIVRKKTKRDFKNDFKTDSSRANSNIMGIGCEPTNSSVPKLTRAVAVDSDGEPINSAANKRAANS